MIQVVRKSEMELRPMYDEILQMDAEKRTREDMDKAFRKYLERMGATEVYEEDIRENVDTLCKMFIPGWTESSHS